MKIAFATVDLLRGRERLMPWRTVIEVARYAQKSGHDVVVLTLPVSADNVEYIYEGIPVRIAPRNFAEFSDYINRKGFDVLYYPTPWREGLKDLSSFASITCRKIAYFPGGSVSLANVMALWHNAGIRVAKPYLTDWLTPYKITMTKLRNAGFSSVIAQSPYTAETCRRGGFDDVHMVVPGKDDFETLDEVQEILDQLNIKGKKYLLFTGAPAPIRGASLLLKAVDEAACADKSICCLFMMRRDVGSDFSMFEKAYSQVIHKDNIVISDNKLTRNELKTIVTHARAVVLPFLLVPSEIPITFFEVLSTGTPVVTFKNGGTTDYLGDSVLVSAPGGIKGLAKNLLHIWQDDSLYEKMKNNAIHRMSDHPSWDVVSRLWLDCINK